VIYAPNLSKIGNEISLSGLIETGDATFGPASMKQSKWTDITSTVSLINSGVTVTSTSVLQNSAVYATFKHPNNIKTALTTVRFRISTASNNFWLTIGYGIRNINVNGTVGTIRRLYYATPKFVNKVSDGIANIVLTTDDLAGDLGPGVICDTIYFYKGNVNGTGGAAYSVSLVDIVYVEEASLNVGNKILSFANGWLSTDTLLVNDSVIIREENIDFNNGGQINSINGKFDIVASNWGYNLPHAFGDAYSLLGGYLIQTGTTTVNTTTSRYPTITLPLAFYNRNYVVFANLELLTTNTDGVGVETIHAEVLTTSTFGLRYDWTSTNGTRTVYWMAIGRSPST
jgi:hypothetical protein